MDFVKVFSSIINIFHSIYAFAVIFLRSVTTPIKVLVAEELNIDTYSWDWFLDLFGEQSPLELMFISGVAFIVIYTLVKWVLDIVL